MNSISLSAIFWGFAVSIGLSFVIGIVLAVVTGVSIASDEEMAGRDMSDEEFARYYLENISDTHFLFGLVVISLLVNALGGYVTACASVSAPWPNAAIMGLLSLLFTILVEWRQPVLPRWVLGLWIIGAIPAALAGAWICTG